MLLLTLREKFGEEIGKNIQGVASQAGYRAKHTFCAGGQAFSPAPSAAVTAEGALPPAFLGLCRSLLFLHQA